MRGWDRPRTPAWEDPAPALRLRGRPSSPHGFSPPLLACRLCGDPLGGRGDGTAPGTTRAAPSRGSVGTEAFSTHRGRLFVRNVRKGAFYKGAESLKRARCQVSSGVLKAPRLLGEERGSPSQSDAAVAGPAACFCLGGRRRRGYWMGLGHSRGRGAHRPPRPGLQAAPMLVSGQEETGLLGLRGKRRPSKPTPAPAAPREQCRAPSPSRNLNNENKAQAFQMTIKNVLLIFVVAEAFPLIVLGKIKRSLCTQGEYCRVIR